MQGISGYGHVAIKVLDLDRALEFYRDRLGFPEMLRLHHDDGATMLVYLRITDMVYLEIFPGAETPHAAGPNANGLHHLCLTVDDMDAVITALGAAGVALTQGVKLGLDGNRQAWTADPDGNRIELMEMSPTSLQARAIARLRAAAVCKPRYG